ncbi:MAG: hypothetical protein GY950_04430 [bacterium]|nr:hypothetical protein [bacterium]
MRKKKTVLRCFLSSYLLIFLSSFLPSVEGHYLLMEPIRDAISTGDFGYFRDISEKKISVNFEAPFDLNGYVPIDKFIEDFSVGYAQYKVERMEWSSKQIDENYAVQSLNVILEDNRSEEDVYYKFIFYMRKDVKWKIYYLRGLRI